MKKLLSVVLALLMLAVMLPVVSLAADRVALNTITEAEDGTYDANTGHVAYTYYTDKMCYRANDTTTPGGTPGGTIPWVKTVTITGVNFGELTDSSSDMALLKKIIMNGRRIDTSAQFKDSIEVKFVNCSFNQTSSTLQVYKIYPCYVTKYTFQNCEFNQSATGQYALTLNVAETAFDNRPISYEITGCTINSSGRGINLVPGTETQEIGNAKPVITISNNTFTLPQNDTSNMALQIAGNWDGANGSEMITFSGNKITAYAAVRIHSSMNNNQTDSVKTIIKFANNTLLNDTKTVVADEATDRIAEIVKAYTERFTPAPTTIVIITPTGDTPKTEDQKNPSTGANDMVAAAAALMAVSALGMAVLSRKK